MHVPSVVLRLRRRRPFSARRGTALVAALIAGGLSVATAPGVARAAEAAPETTIEVRPVEAWPSSVAFFTYGATPAESIASYECRLTLVPMQAGSFVPCPTTGREFTGLGDGTYRFEVRAISTAGVRDPTPASYLFTVDTVAPETLITAAPIGTIRAPTASFAYGGWPREDVAEIECRLGRDGEPTPLFEVCDLGGRTFDDLPDGSYTFEARARDAAGSVDTSPATRDFRVDTVAPTATIGAGPAETTVVTTATFAYAALPVDDVQRIECRLVGPGEDDPAFADCPRGGVTYEDLGPGAYRFELRAADAVGNVSDPVDWRFRVERAGPTDPGPTDPGPTDPGPSDPGPTDPGPTDPGPTDPGPTDPGPTDPGPSDPGPTDPSPPGLSPPAGRLPVASPLPGPSALPGARPPRISGLRLAPARFRPWTTGPSVGPRGGRTKPVRPREPSDPAAGPRGAARATGLPGHRPALAAAEGIGQALRDRRDDADLRARTDRREDLARRSLPTDRGRGRPCDRRPHDEARGVPDHALAWIPSDLWWRLRTGGTRRPRRR